VLRLAYNWSLLEDRMFYKVKVNDYIRVEPKLFGLKVEESVTKKIKEKYEGYISQGLGIVVDLIEVQKIKEGTIIPGDGASYFETEFELLTYEPELQEVTMGRVKDVSDFGVFMSIGPIEGMIHISQTMDDFVSFSKDKVLAGKESKRVLKVGDKCKARMIAVSYKDISNPKIGLTMRQQGLGKLEWLEEDSAKTKK
jgi:DNA-directed RNA polymerase subunit E'